MLTAKYSNLYPFTKNIVRNLLPNKLDQIWSYDLANAIWLANFYCAWIVNSFELINKMTESQNGRNKRN